MSLLEWKESGLQLIKALRARGEEDAFRRLLSDLYPYTAHFIYELLQNAEDTKASSVKFTLNEGGLEFSHDGERLFTEKDVIAITSFGNSTKRDDPTSIGKFGVGFKAVFAYTNTPEIQSGKFHFRIHDLVIPETEGLTHSKLDGKQTRFKFPFNHAIKPPRLAAFEVSQGLQALQDNALLFLSHINKIEYVLFNGTTGSLERFNHDSIHLEIRAEHPDATVTVSHWLRFTKDVRVIDDDGTPKDCRIAIAYLLAEEEDKKTSQKRWKIIPLESGQVSIYFPAEKETSNLRFHLHAPFASTVARDSVRDCQANRQLRDCLAELVVESLIAIRNRGLLTVGFLSVLPNVADNLPAFYEPIRKAIIQAFQTQALTPTRSGAHAPANSLYRGPVRIAEVLDDKDLSLLTSSPTPFWVANPPQQNQREDRFIDSLDIQAWGWDELAKMVSGVENENDRGGFERWINYKTDDWVLRFYALLGDACAQARTRKVKVHYLLNIVRYAGYDKVSGHFFPSYVFFPPIDGTTPPDDIKLVKPAVYSSGGSEAQKQSARHFLEQIGVRVFDEKVTIERRLIDYKLSPERIKDAQHLKDLELFVDFLARNPYRMDMFATVAFVFDGDKKLSMPHELFVDAPYRETGLSGAVSIHGKRPLWAGYYDKWKPAAIKKFASLMVSTGAITCLQVTPSPLYKNPEWYQRLRMDGVRMSPTHSIEEDFTIERLDEYLSHKSIVCSRLVWNCLIEADSSVSKARFRPNSNYAMKEADSLLVYKLKQQAWIPDRQGVFRKPQEITREELPEDFRYDNGNGLLTSIGFGENALKRSREYQAKNQKARDIGFDSFEEAEETARILKETHISPKELKSLLTQRKPVEQPEGRVTNPERRRKGVLERQENAPTKESIIRERKIQPGINSAIAEAKAYLRPNYTNSNAELVCQCCHQEMPFKVGDSYYFEAVQCVRQLDKQYVENRLALCPTCAAMYQYARQTEEEELIRRLVEHDAPDDSPAVAISVTLAGQDYQLNFVGKHWFDLKTLLKA